jgi:hypothetical protein
MNAHSPIFSDQRRTDQLGQLAGWMPAEKVHLEKAILPMDKSGGKSQVISIVGTQGWDTSLVALDSHRRRQAENADRSIQGRQTIGEKYPDADSDDRTGAHGQADKDTGDAQDHPPTPARRRALW